LSNSKEANQKLVNILEEIEIGCADRYDRELPNIRRHLDDDSPGEAIEFAWTPVTTTRWANK
jgi:hypothetical protein